MSRARALAVVLAALGVAACPSTKPLATIPATAPSASASVDVPLGEVTLQAALEAAWDGDFLLCYKRARTAMIIAPDDLETLELTMRCAHAQHALWDAVNWARTTYAKRPIVQRYALGVAAHHRPRHAGERDHLLLGLSQLLLKADDAAVQVRDLRIEAGAVGAV